MPRDHDSEPARAAVATWLAAYVAYRDSGHAPPPVRRETWRAYVEARTLAVVALLAARGRRVVLPSGEVWSTDGLLLTYRLALPKRRSA